MAELVACPFCKGEIAVDAAKCRHCGEWVKERPADGTTAPPPRVRTSDDSFLTRQRGCADLILWPILLFAIACAAFCAFGVSR